MTNPTLTLEVRDGSDDSIKASETIKEAEPEQNFPKLGEIRECEVIATRPQWDTIDAALDRRNDWLVVIGPDDDVRFRGRLKDVRSQQGAKQITLLGTEIDANDAEPTGPNVFYRNVEDSTIVTDIIDGADGLPGIPTLNAGQIDTVAPALSFSASNATPLKALRDVAEATGADLRFNDDKTIDYLDRRGEDKSDDITLRPGNSTVIGEPRVTEDELEDVTHVRGFGAQDGAEQIRADGVAPSYEQGDRKTWREYENTDIREQSRLQKIVDEQAAEYDANDVQVDIEDLQTPRSTINVGDTIHISLPEEGIDMDLRVLKRRDLLSAGAGGLLSLMLSNRIITRDGNQSDREKLQRFNRGYQGRITRDNVGQGNWQLVEDASNVRAELPYVYPDDVIDEIEIRLDVRGRAWRSPVDDDGHSHAVTIPDHNHNVSISDTTTSTDNTEFTAVEQTVGGVELNPDSGVVTESIPASASGSELRVRVGIYMANSTTDTRVDLFRNGEQIDQSVGGFASVDDTTPGRWETKHLVFDPVDPSNHTYEIEIYGQDDTDNWAYYYRHDVIGNHTHDISISDTSTTSDGGGTTESTTNEIAFNPTVVTEFDGQEFYPEGRIEVNGTTVATDIGTQSDSWDVTLGEELLGELSPGKNSIEFVAENGSRGEVMLSLVTETFIEGRTD